LKTVASLISPRFKRTHFPSFKSMAGKRITVRLASARRTGGGHQIAFFACDKSPSFSPVKHKSDSSPMPLAFLSSPPPALARRALTETDAVDIWIARWLRVRRVDLVRRYGCDPRRIYEIWEEVRFPSSRAKALDEFKRRFPKLIERVDSGPHRRIPRTPHPDQLSLFE
jgi:hypothetical protein